MTLHKVNGRDLIALAGQEKRPFFHSFTITSDLLADLSISVLSLPVILWHVIKVANKRFIGVFV